MAPLSGVDNLEVRSDVPAELAQVITAEALQFVARLEQAHGERRRELLAAREARQVRLNQGERPDFLNETAHVRASDWQVAPTPDELQRRWVEITGPTDRKMIINALNSGADVFMADFEDSNVPTWLNMLQGQQNLREAVAGTLVFDSPDGKHYQLSKERALLMVRPRGWHLDERHVWLNGKPISGALFDFGLFVYHNAHRLLELGSRPCFYLPKMESHLEARLWNEVFVDAQNFLGLPQSTIRATVLIETVLAAFEMDEILYELREHCAGLNAGRWDYIFSAIKKFHTWSDCLLPDRSQVTMTVPFMRAYTNLLIKTCHRRWAHAMGGMAAFVPSRKDAEVNAVAIEQVQRDKQRETSNGFDGTWVAHPDLVPVARPIFAEALNQQPHQKDRLREDVQTTAEMLLDITVPEGQITEKGLRNNISVTLQYLSAWLQGSGAVAIFNLMEDAATAEISRSQLWQWLHHPQARLSDGRAIEPTLYLQLVDEELSVIRKALGDELFEKSCYLTAQDLLNKLVVNNDFTEFLTLPASDLLHEAGA